MSLQYVIRVLGDSWLTRLETDIVMILSREMRVASAVDLAGHTIPPFGRKLHIQEKKLCKHAVTSHIRCHTAKRGAKILVCRIYAI